MTTTEPSDSADWLLRGHGFGERGLWEEALSCYRKALDLSCGDSVGWRDGHAARLGMKECLPRLTGRLGLVLDQFSARTARDAGSHGALARDLKARLPAQTLDALRDLLAWAAALDAPTLEAAVRPLMKPGDTVPIEIIRRYLSAVAEQIRSLR